MVGEGPCLLVRTWRLGLVTGRVTGLGGADMVSGGADMAGEVPTLQMWTWPLEVRTWTLEAQT
jgi:hypothetical protein